VNGWRRTLRELGPDDALTLLASVPYGRVVFTTRALPAIRPVNHLVEDGHIIVRSHHGTAITNAVEQAGATVVAFQADSIDPATRLGWSVVVTGQALLVTDPAEVERYERLLAPWLDASMDSVIRISCDIVAGYELVAVPDPDLATPMMEVRAGPAGRVP
jgi:nitroimidazol reductase NimA-like FMN-containing flavoprotein (pyridoxamine 5'-phosphate oxidase superfamily)